MEKETVLENETHQWEVNQSKNTEKIEESEEESEDSDVHEERIQLLEKRQKKTEETLRWDLLKRMKQRDLIFCLCRVCVINCTLCCLVHSLTVALCLYVFIDSISSKVNEIPKIETSTQFEELSDYDLPAIALCTQFPTHCDAQMDLNVTTGRGKHLTYYTFSQSDHLGNFWTCFASNVAMDHKYETLDVFTSLRLSVNVMNPPGKSCVYVPLVLILLNTTQFAKQSGFSSIGDMLETGIPISEFLSFGVEVFGSKGTLVSNNALNFMKYREQHYFQLAGEDWESSYPLSSTTVVLDTFQCFSVPIGVNVSIDRCVFVTETQIMRVNPTEYFVEYTEMKWYSPIFAVGGVLGTFGIMKLIVDCVCSGGVIFGQKMFDKCVLMNVLFRSSSSKKLKKMKKKKKKKKHEKVKKKMKTKNEEKQKIKEKKISLQVVEEDQKMEEFDIEEEEEDESFFEEEEEGEFEDDEDEMFREGSTTSTDSEEEEEEEEKE